MSILELQFADVSETDVDQQTVIAKKPNTTSPL
jgi:hypothetical protein